MSKHSGEAGRKNRKHKKKNHLLRIAILLGLIGVGVLIYNLPYFQVTQIAVIGNKEVTDEEILNLSQIRERDSIFSVHPIIAGSHIKENRYIKEVNVDRHLPSTVEIIVQERKPTAQLPMEVKGNKKYVIIDQDGLVLDIADKKQKVTTIAKVKVTGAQIGKTIAVKETGVYNKAMQLIEVTRAGDLYFKRIVISGSRVEAYIYNKLVCKGRYNNLVKSIQSGELKAVVYRIYQMDVRAGTINIGDNNYCSFTREK